MLITGAIGRAERTEKTIASTDLSRRLQPEKVLPEQISHAVPGVIWTLLAGNGGSMWRQRPAEAEVRALEMALAVNGHFARRLGACRSSRERGRAKPSSSPTFAPSPASPIFFAARGSRATSASLASAHDQSPSPRHRRGRLYRQPRRSRAERRGLGRRGDRRSVERHARASCRTACPSIEGSIADRALVDRILRRAADRRDHAFRGLDRGSGIGRAAARLLSQQHASPATR